MFLASLCTQNQSLFAEVRTGPRSSFWFHVKYYWCSIVNFITFNLCNKSSALNIENSKLQTSSLYYWKVPTILKCIVLIFRTSAHEHVLSKGANWCGGRTGNFRSCHLVHCNFPRPYHKSSSMHLLQLYFGILYCNVNKEKIIILHLRFASGYCSVHAKDRTSGWGNKVHVCCVQVAASSSYL